MGACAGVDTCHSCCTMPLAGEHRVGSRIFKGEAQRRRAGRPGHFPQFFFVWEKVANLSPSFTGTAASKKMSCIFFVPTSPGLRRCNGSCMIRSFASCRGNTHRISFATIHSLWGTFGQTCRVALPTAISFHAFLDVTCWSIVGPMFSPC